MQPHKRQPKGAPRSLLVDDPMDGPLYGKMITKAIKCIPAGCQGGEPTVRIQDDNARPHCARTVQQAMICALDEDPI